MENNSFMDIISSDIQSIKERFSTQIKHLGLPFNDDIFSETILKCSKQLADKTLNKQEAISYFWVSFKLNSLRETKYLRNKTTDAIPEITEEETEEDGDLYNQVKSIIISTFGEEIFRLFTLHVNGTPYEELIEQSGIENLKYVFRRVRETVRETIN